MKMSKSSTKAPSKTRTVPYDVAEQLRTPEEMAAYLNAWLSESPDDAAGIARALVPIYSSSTLPKQFIRLVRVESMTYGFLFVGRVACIARKHVSKAGQYIK